MWPRVEVIASTTKILMHSLLSGRNKKKIKLINQSKVVAKFMFDIIPRQYITFQPDILCGKIQPNSHVNITITFLPMEKKIHYFPLVCLILHGKPIIIELYGYCEIPLNEQDGIIFGYELYTGLNTFEKYFNDNSRIKRSHQTPILSLSQNYLIFEKSSTLNPCQTSSITNHSSYELILEWEKENLADVDSVFTVDPQSLRISSGKSGHFRISFKPQSDQGKCYVRDIALYGTIKSLKIEHAFTLIRLMGYWSSNKIECMGNRESRNKKRMEQLVNNGQNIITLPPCTPGSSSYTTFLIMNDTDDPLTFQLIPPYSNSVPKQFNVKPILGIIYLKYQIVAVEMFPDAISEHFYSERWSIKFNVNSDEQSFVHIEFQGLSQFPNIRIGNSDIYNEINFSPVHPGCQTIQSVPMKNLTRHSISYVFSNLPSYISLDNLSGVLSNDEVQFFNWTFSPSVPKQYECNILCSITAIEEYARTKKPVEISVRISAISAIASLKAEPDEFNFTEIPYNELRKFKFHIFNVSEVEMCFKLISKPATGEACCDEISEFELHPIFGNILRTERQEIMVSLVPRKVGFFKFIIMYAANESQNSITICTVNYTCTLPMIKIIDLQYHNINPNFGKLTLWRLLKINLLNKIIAEMELNTEKRIDIHMPEIAASNDLSIIKLLVKNVGSVPAYWRLKKNLMASSNKSLDEISNVIHPKCGKMQPNDEIVVTIRLNEAIHCKQCQWQISLGQNRQIIFTVDHSSRILYGPNFILDDVYLGDLYPKYQAFWLYNPTSHDLIFSIDIEAFDLINAHHRAVALTCVKPIGSIPTQMLCPILVKFQPRRSDSFTILIPIIVGETETSLMMEGGTNLIHRQMKIPRELPQLSKTFYIPEVSVYINTDNIILSDIPLRSRVICPITLSNRSNNEIFGYEWKSCSIINIIYLSVIPLKGRIQPSTTHSFELIVETGNTPCRIDVNIACQLINYTAKRIHWRLMDYHNRQSKKIKEQFTITNEGIYSPIVKYPKNVPDPTVPFHRILTVCCMTSGNVKNDDDIILNVPVEANNLPTEIWDIAFKASVAIIRNILRNEMLEYIIHVRNQSS